MPRGSRTRIVVDTNCWISFLIGQRLKRLVSLLSDERIELIFCEEMLAEIRDVTSRPKFAKYFRQADVESLIDFMYLIGEHIEPRRKVKLCRDEADDYLLALAIEAKAKYLITGDDDLLSLHAVEGCQIVTAAAFEHLMP